MEDRTYRTLLGVCLLIVLYFDLQLGMYGIIGLLFVEGITNQRLPKVVYAIRGFISKQELSNIDLDLVQNARFNFEAERLWRLLVGLFLIIGYSLIEALWFFPWFMGFAIFGAGISGVCPVLIAIRYLGFK